MEYKLGDFVRFVEENFEGHITKIVSDDMVAVTGEDGFEIPVQTSKITKVYGQQNRKDVDFDEPVKTAVVPSGPFIKDGIWLAITGDHKQNIAQLAIVNETSYELLVNVITEKAQQQLGIFGGVVTQNSAQQFYTAKISEISSWPLFKFQFLFHSTQAGVFRPPLLVDKRIKPLDLSDSKKHVPLLNRRAWLLKLDEHELPLDVDRLKDSLFSHRPEKKR